MMDIIDTVFDLCRPLDLHTLRQAVSTTFKLHQRLWKSTIDALFVGRSIVPNVPFLNLMQPRSTSLWSPPCPCDLLETSSTWCTWKKVAIATAKSTWASLLIGRMYAPSEKSTYWMFQVLGSKAVSTRRLQLALNAQVIYRWGFTTHGVRTQVEKA